MSSLLQAIDISQTFGGVRALSNVRMTVSRGELLSLIGPNGAGKTTLLRTLLGIVRPTVGRILFGTTDITGYPVYRRAQIGIALAHQIVRPFRNMTLLENVMVASEPKLVGSPIRSLFHVDQSRARERAMLLLQKLGIDDSADKLASIVPLGYLKRLQVARALASDPSILLLDEPLAGLNYSEANRMADTIAELNHEGMTILLVEHNLGEVMRISQRLVVLANGSVLAEGRPEEVMQRDDVRAAYLGEGAHNA